MHELWLFIANAVDSALEMVDEYGAIFVLAAGLFSVFFGRRTFWVFLAIAGFLAGRWLGFLLLDGQSSWVRDTLALVLGITVGLAALLLQRWLSLLVGFVGFLLLGYVLVTPFEVSVAVQWGVAVVLGLCGAVLTYYLFDWTLVLMSALVGAAVALLGLRALGTFPGEVGVVLFLLLAVAGVWYQWRDILGLKLIGAPVEALSEAGVPAAAAAAGVTAAAAALTDPDEHP